MKKFLLLLLFIIPIVAQSQSTPPAADFVPLLSSSVRDYGDTINFEGFLSNTPITDNFWENGAIFSGYNGSGNPVTYDYGINVYTSVLHSDDWYNPLKLRFVDVNDTSAVKPISHLSFYNPVSSEIDYIKVVVYDYNDIAVATYMSTSPEWVSIDIENALGSYVVLDDSDYTAYVIDYVSFEPGGKPTGIINSESSSTNSVVYPNPVDESFAIMVKSSMKIQNGDLTIYNSGGIPVKQYENIHTNSIVLAKREFETGIYYYTIKDEANKMLHGTFLVQ